MYISIVFSIVNEMAQNIYSKQRTNIYKKSFTHIYGRKYFLREKKIPNTWHNLKKILGDIKQKNWKTLSKN
jgi:hypothetical protein